MSYVISKSFAFESFRLLLIERSCWLMYGMILRCLTPKWYSLCLLRSLWRCKSCRPAFSRVTLSSKNSSFSFLRYQSSSRMSKIFLLAFFEPTHWCDYFPWMWTQLRLSLTMWCRVQYCFRSLFPFCFWVTWQMRKEILWRIEQWVNDYCYLIAQLLPPYFHPDKMPFISSFLHSVQSISGVRLAVVLFPLKLRRVKI